MILQALTKYYEDMHEAGILAAPGWKEAKVSYGLEVNETGELEAVVPLLQEVDTGKKIVFVPSVTQLPAIRGSRSSGLNPFFLWDNSKYMLGIEENPKKKAELSYAATPKAIERFTAARALYHELLKDVDTPMAHAMCNFYDTWDPYKAGEHPALAPYIDEIAKGVNLVFMNNGELASADTQVCDAWQRHYNRSGGKLGQCLVTGKEDIISVVHPKIMGVKGAQSTGAALVSFNGDAFCSYGKEQGYNAPVGEYAAFAYTTALNYLLSKPQHRRYIGDTTVVYWSNQQNEVIQDFVSAALFGQLDKEKFDYKTVENAMFALAKGNPFDEYSLDPNAEYYILGLAPSAARISVRFFYKNSLGHLMKNVAEHHRRMEIQRPAYDEYETVPLWKMLAATSSPESTSSPLNSPMAGALTRAILDGTMYPASLLSQTMIRIRREKRITRERAAILKAYHLRNQHHQCPEEVLTVSLNEDATNVPYNLGRLFALYEEIQARAHGGSDINASICDRFFIGAQASPATVFPYLGRLCQHHIAKIEKTRRGDAIYYGRLIVEIKSKLGTQLPKQLSLAEQSAFDLGYYHQTQKRYEPKKKGDNDTNNNKEEE